ncbi:MAG: spermidine synthase [Opitutae bacterium]|nr:spermidine synthase [Opitutae bacterium]
MLIFEELDFNSTPIGDLVLRRRRIPKLGDIDVYEVKLGDDFLMSSLFHEAEHQLAKLGLDLMERDDLDVVVGGLGLGYTAVAALEDPRVSSLVVIEYLAPVIEWHQSGLVPLGETLALDDRCRLIHGDFFALSRNIEKSFDPMNAEKKHDAILLDIDHTPTNVLHQTNSHFYTEEGLSELAKHLKPGGIFALWADGEPETFFTDRLGKIWGWADAHTIEFDNPITEDISKGTVYLAQNPK